MSQRMCNLNYVISVFGHVSSRVVWVYPIDIDGADKTTLI